MRDRQTCVGCGKQSPETETNYTLISAQFGWRLSRFKTPDGSLVVEWRCPTCWREYKKNRASRPDDGPASVSGVASPPNPILVRTPVPKIGAPLDAMRPRTPSKPGSEPPRRSSAPAASPTPSSRFPTTPPRPGRGSR